MKLEKREITLNERDSLQDVFLFERTLLRAYSQALEATRRKENQNCFFNYLQETAKELCCIKDHQQRIEENAAVKL